MINSSTKCRSSEQESYSAVQQMRGILFIGGLKCLENHRFTI